MTARLALLAIVASATLAAPPLPAQRIVQAGRGTVSTAIRVGLVIPPRLRFRVAGAPRLERQQGDTATWTMDVEVAANLDWTLHAVASDADGATAPLRVKDAQGEWRTLGAGDMIPVVVGQAPGNWRPVRVELQVIGPPGPRAARAITFDLQAAQH